jgi:hypothetical protein
MAGIFYLLCPFTLFHDRMALTEAGLSAFTALTLLFSIRVAESGGRRFAVLAGLSFALAVLVKALGVLALPIPLVTVLVLGPVRARLGALALAYAVGLPPAAWAFRSFVATENAQHMAELFTGGGGALTTRLAASLLEGASWLWTWCTPPLVVLGLLGAALAVGRTASLLLALLAVYPLVAFSSVLSWRMPRYLLPAAVPLLVLAAGSRLLVTRLLAWTPEAPQSGARGSVRGRRAGAFRAASTARNWTDPARAACRGRPLPVRARLALGLRVRDTERRCGVAAPDGLTVVVTRIATEPARRRSLGLAFAREPRVSSRTGTSPMRRGPASGAGGRGAGLLVVPAPIRPGPRSATWAHLATLVARTRKPDGGPCDDVYRLCAAPGCSVAGPATR